MNRKAKDVQIVNSPLAKDDLYVIVLTNDGIDNESIIYFVGMKCVQNTMGHAKTTFEFKKSDKDYFSNINSLILKCELNQYDIYTGVKLNLDQFIVNSFMFISNEPLFVVSVDNFGLLVIDIVSKSIVDKLSFTEMIENFPNEFMITNIFPIEKNGIRILIEDHGEFSLFWKRIAKIGDQDHVFVELKVLEYQISFTQGATYDLIDYSNEGYSRIILQEIESNEYYLANVQIYFNYYHENSKKSKEIKLGYVTICEFISQDFIHYRIVVIWGSKAYLIFISVYPWLLINQNSMQRELNLKINVLNEVSFKQLNIYIKNVDSRKLLPNWIVGLCFISLIVIVVLLVPYAFNFWRYSKEKKPIPKILKLSGNCKGLLNHETSAEMNHRLQPPKNFGKNKTRLVIEKEKGTLDDSLQPSTNDISSKIRNKQQIQESSEENFNKLKIRTNQNENNFVGEIFNKF